MTANALPEQVREFRQAGMDDHVAKPFKQHDLHEAIRRAVEMPAVRDQAGNRPGSDAHPSTPSTERIECPS